MDSSCNKNHKNNMLGSFAGTSSNYFFHGSSSHQAHVPGFQLPEGDLIAGIPEH